MDTSQQQAALLNSSAVRRLLKLREIHPTAPNPARNDTALVEARLLRLRRLVLSTPSALCSANIAWVMSTTVGAPGHARLIGRLGCRALGGAERREGFPKNSGAS